MHHDRRKSHVSTLSHIVAERVCLSLSMEARVIALEERLRQTEEVLVAERLARQTAEAAQQTVGPQPAGAGDGGERPPGLPSLVDTKAIGKPPTFSGDIDVNGQPEGMTWSQWIFAFRSYLGAFDPAATRLLRQVETNVEDPVVVDNTSMTEVERRLSKQLFHVLALTCRGKALQVVRRVPEGFGFEAWERRLSIQLVSVLALTCGGNSCAESLSPVFRHDSKECSKPSCGQRKWTFACRQSTTGRRRSRSTSNSQVTKCRKPSSLLYLQKYLCDGELGRHLKLQSARLTTYDLARKEAINCLRAKQTWTASGKRQEQR